jgi:hypothetical protein
MNERTESQETHAESLVADEAVAGLRQRRRYETPAMTELDGFRAVTAGSGPPPAIDPGSC